MVQALQYGADVNLVEGTYDLAFDKSIEYTDRFGGLTGIRLTTRLRSRGKRPRRLKFSPRRAGPPIICLYL